MENQNIIDEESVKISRYSFNSFRIERSIRDILSWEERGKIIIPDFQREFVWDYNQCCKFIESILLGLPVPDMFIFRDRTTSIEKFILIDGLQRYTCIKQFVNGKFIAKGTERKFAINIKNSEWYKYTYDSLSVEDKAMFDDYSLRMNVFDSIENNESLKKLYMQEIFERINTGSEKLTDQEIRNAVYSGNVISKIKELASNESYKNLVRTTNKYTSRCYDQELILRFITYYNIYKQSIKGSNLVCEEGTEKITNSKKNMLSNYLYYANINKIDYLEHIELLTEALNYLNEYSENIFLSVSADEEKILSTVHEVFAEAIVICRMLGCQIKITKEELDMRKINYWKKTSKEDNPFYSSTTSVANVIKRIDVIKELIGE